MDDIIYQKILDLKQSILEDPRLLELRKKEVKMNEDEVVISLSKKKERINSELNQCMKVLDANDPKILDLRRELSLVLIELNKVNSVQEYLKAFDEYKKMTDLIDKVLFSDIKLNRVSKK